MTALLLDQPSIILSCRLTPATTRDVLLSHRDLAFAGEWKLQQPQRDQDASGQAVRVERLWVSSASPNGCKRGKKTNLENKKNSRLHVTTPSVKVHLRLRRVKFGIPQNCVLQLCNWPINTAWEAVSLCDNDLLPNLAVPGSLGHVRAGEKWERACLLSSDRAGNLQVIRVNLKRCALRPLSRQVNGLTNTGTTPRKTKFDSSPQQGSKNVFCVGADPAFPSVVQFKNRNGHK